MAEPLAVAEEDHGVVASGCPHVISRGDDQGAAALIDGAAVEEMERLSDEP